MSPSSNSKLFEKIKELGQEQVFTFFETLSPENQSALIQQLENIDVERVNKIWKNLQENNNSNVKLDSKFLNPLEEVKKTFDAAGNYTEEAKEWREIGLEAIKNGEVNNVDNKRLLH